jgi:hypothetical protein
MSANKMQTKVEISRSVPTTVFNYDQIKEMIDAAETELNERGGVPSFHVAVRSGSESMTTTVTVMIVRHKA